MSLKSPLIALFLAFALLLAACGSDGITDVEVADGNDAPGAQADDSDGDGADPIEPETEEELPEGPIPVEPDGGIGDGAEPLPGFEEPEDEGTWHGAVVAETNCPGMTWQRVEASVFSFSVPSDFTELDLQGIDSEVGTWTNGAGIEASYDYGWYTGSLAQMPHVDVEEIDYSGFVGEQAIVRGAAADPERNMVGVYFGEVEQEEGLQQWNKLGLVVTHTDPNDEIIGRCIVGSIEWN